MNSIFNYIAIKITSLITMPILTTMYNMIFGKSINRVSIMIPANCGEMILKNSLQSNTCVVCNLDIEINNELDEDDKLKSLNVGNTLNASRIIYNKASQIVSDLEDIAMNTSNATTTMLYISSDYRLLKYSGVVNIEYFIPSEEYHNKLMLNSGWNEVKYQVTKNDLIARKSNKLHIFTSSIDLQSQLLVLYPSLSIRI